MRSRPLVLLAYSGILVSAVCCAPALRPAAPILEPARQSPGERPADPAALVERAREAMASRDLQGMRSSAPLWLEAVTAEKPRRRETVLGLVRVRVWLAEHEDSSERREEAAKAAVEAAQWCGQVSPGDPECDYWLGAALGLQARERPSTGKDALKHIEEAFQRAAAGAPAIERGGPDRALALFYARAPGWPIGPGDPEAGVPHAKRAVELDPDYPPNLLALAETLKAVGDATGSRRAAQQALDIARQEMGKGVPEADGWAREAEALLPKRSSLVE